ncbi:MAG: NAD/NADP octopine/nopaline dehydrogenase family protein [Anaerolineales bacterium]
MRKLKRRFAVIGAGNGGRAMAAHLALMGQKVMLYNRTPSKIEVIKQMGGVRLRSFEGGPNGFGKLELVSSDYSEVIPKADLIMVVVPSSAHADVAEKICPFLKDRQIIILHPGRTGGSIHVNSVLHQCGLKARVTIAEAETFIYASRSEGPAEARIFRIKEAVPLAALPATSTRKVLDILKPIYPEFIDGVDVLHTSLNNMGGIFHPALALLNAGWIERTGGDFQFYIDGVTKSTARVLEVLDRERVTVASAIGIRARSALEWLQISYNVYGDSIYEAIHDQEGYYGIMAPKSLNHRYIFEDIPMSLVPLASFAKRYGVSVRGIESLIRLACFVHQTDYWSSGRTLEKLGIERMSVGELTNFVKTGSLDVPIRKTA